MPFYFRHVPAFDVSMLRDSSFFFFSSLARVTSSVPQYFGQQQYRDGAENCQKTPQIFVSESSNNK